jgi:uncharacterized protein
MDNPDEDIYPCVGICMADPDSGYCLGCGRPPLASPVVIAEVVQPSAAPVANQDTEQPE